MFPLINTQVKRWSLRSVVSTSCGYSGYPNVFLVLLDILLSFWADGNLVALSSLNELGTVVFWLLLLLRSPPVLGLVQAPRQQQAKPSSVMLLSCFNYSRTQLLAACFYFHLFILTANKGSHYIYKRMFQEVSW